MNRKNQICLKMQCSIWLVGLDTDNIYYGPSCECWLNEVFEETENSLAQEVKATNYALNKTEC